MLAIEIEITRFVDDHWPGFVECALIDAHGRKHLFIEKVPVVTLSDLDSNSIYPTAGILGCELVKGSTEPRTDIISVSTTNPWGIESTQGLFDFDVRPDQLVEFVRKD